MEIQISSVNMRYVDGKVGSVQIHFNGNDAARTISINGYIPLTSEEYRGNEDIDILEDMVRQSVANRILVDEEDMPAEDPEMY